MLAAVVVVLFVPTAAAPKGIPEGEVVYAVWTVGKRFDREEWLERATGATHRRDTGGPACPRHMVANQRWILRYGVVGGVECDPPILYRVRSPADRHLRDSSDLLRPRRMLRLGQAKVVRHLLVDGLPALRVQIPWRYGTEYADIERGSQLPLRFVFIQNGAEVDVWKLRYRSKRRSSVPTDFFSPRR